MIQLRYLIPLLCFTISNLNSQDLDKHKWESRVLIVQTSEVHAPLYQNQLAELIGSESELAERKLVIYQVHMDHYKLNDYLSKSKSKDWTSVDQLFHQILNEKDSFKVILIGLDGGVKLKQNEVLTKVNLFRIIDSMPMRKSEMRNKD